MKELYIIRHTPPKIEVGTCYGSSDVDVNDDFKKKAALIKQMLCNYTPDYLFSSPLQRCSKLAKELFPCIKPQYDNRLQEMDFGHWEMKLWNEIKKDEMEKWSSDFINNAPPGGECFKDFNQKAIHFFNEINSTIPQNSTAVIISHSGIIRCLLSKFLEIPLNKIFSLKINYGAVIKITLHPEFEEVEIIKNTEN